MTATNSNRAREYRQIVAELLSVAQTASDEAMRSELLGLAENYGRLANAVATGRLASGSESGES
jgi:hypothetical protein